jgi:hypothetical protein
MDKTFVSHQFPIHCENKHNTRYLNIISDEFEYEPFAITTTKRWWRGGAKAAGGFPLA